MAKKIFGFCAFLSVAAVAAIAFYVVLKGLPALIQPGFKEILFNSRWAPVAEKPEYGILYVILASAAGTGLALALGLPVGILTAVFIAEIADRKTAETARAAVEIMAGIPSVIYGLLGIYLLSPAVYRLELFLFKGSRSHCFTGGANLLSASLVLAVMILPTVINISENAIRTVPDEIREASLALGASRIQTVFRCVLPAAKQGIALGAVLGAGRAIGEAMAVMLVSGNSVSPPAPFNPVRFLSSAIAGEMGYASGTHRMVLFTVGLVLFAFIMALNLVLTGLLKKEPSHD